MLGNRQVESYWSSVVMAFFTGFLYLLWQPLVFKLYQLTYGSSKKVTLSIISFFIIISFFAYATNFILSRTLPRLQSLVGVYLVVFIAGAILVSGSAFEPADNPQLSLLVLVQDLVLKYSLVFLALSLITVRVFGEKQFSARRQLKIYGVSAFGSMLGFIVFPVFLEPYYGISEILLWTRYTLIALFLAGALYQAYQLILFRSEAPREGKFQFEFKKLHLRLFMIGLVSSLSFGLIISTFIQMNTSPIAWISIYSMFFLASALTFVFHFFRPMVLPLWIAVATFYVVVQMPDIYHDGTLIDWILFWVFLFIVFFSQQALHAEVFHRLYSESELDDKLLMFSFGGAVGFCLATWVIPSVVVFHFDIQLGIICLLFYLFVVTRGWKKFVTVILAVASIYSAIEETEGVVYADRSLLGSIEVKKTFLPKLGVYADTLWHNNGFYGFQIKDPKYENIPGFVYGTDSSFGRLIRMKQGLKGNIHFGMIGLGAGAMTMHANSGDRCTIYEIDPAMVKIAREHFTYLSQSKADIEIVVGDARRSIQREIAQNKVHDMDLLVLDGQQGLRMPTHLLTVEAFQEYFKKLKSDGIIYIVFDIAAPYTIHLLNGIADEIGAVVEFNEPKEDYNNMFHPTAIMYMEQAQESLEPFSKSLAYGPLKIDESPVVWYDERHSRLDILDNSFGVSAIIIEKQLKEYFEAYDGERTPTGPLQ